MDSSRKKLTAFLQDMNPWPRIRNMGTNVAQDTLAGETVAFIALPLALGFGVASGLGAITGLWGAIAGGLIGGLTTATATMRSIANLQCGAKTILATIVHGGVLLALVLGLSPLASYIPMGCLAAILFIVGYDIFEIFVCSPFCIAFLPLQKLPSGPSSFSRYGKTY